MIIEYTMNYQSLKWMIESIIKNYKCPQCSNSVVDTNIDIIWAAWNTINIDIECSNCWKHSMIKTEVLSIDLTNKNVSIDNIKKIKQRFSKNNVNLIWWNKSIKDTEIVDLNKNLRKEKLNVSDLFWEDK